MNMDWVPSVIFTLGIIDALAVMLGGLVLAALILTGRDTGRFNERVWPALGILLISNVVAALILFATRYMVS